ncbi:enoyl-CoA hydratase-related protein [Limimaricola sp.]|uniref:enoyl-CoA hydratase/isomerase family protein n=1 Tax=Limimaricola sp. TaxID=2211665 RepID=UPI0025C064FA|nr:enoyl-CoA hydratase-related protein [Limimaricola sp.]
MAELVKSRIHGDGVAVVMLAAPPANVMGPEMRAALHAAFLALGANGKVSAVVLLAEGPSFSSGTSLRDYATRPDRHDPTTLSALCRMIEDFPHPVVAGLHGFAMGAGAEVALAAHYRLIAPDTAIGLPEVGLGLTPRGGGTQRLPRLVGAGPALDILLGGRAVRMQSVGQPALYDGVVNGHLPSAAMAFAQNLISRGAGPRPTATRREGLLDGPGFLAAVADRRKAIAGSPLHAPPRIIDCVEAALLLPLDAGLAFEAAAFDAAETDPQSHALRHIALAERRLPKHLVTTEDGQQKLTEAGEAVTGRLRAALRAAVSLLAGRGVPKAQIDSAMLAYGFARSPHGGGDRNASGPVIDEVQRRCIAAVMAEGARQVQAGHVARPADIDALAVIGMGFPRFRGGPMQGATQMGLLSLMNEMEGWTQENRLWTVPPLMREAVKYAGGFAAVPPQAFSAGSPRPQPPSAPETTAGTPPD